MSIDIGAIGRQQVAAPATAVAGAAGASTTDPDTSAVDAADDDQAVSVSALPASPPPELSDAIAAAADAYDQLAASGRSLHFALDPPTGRLTIQLQDSAGNVLSTLSPSQVLDAADGSGL